MKICSKCNNKKYLNEDNFRKCKYSNGIEYFKKVCRDCERDTSRKYVAKHRNERKEYSKKYLLNNPNYIKQWKKDNRNIINEQFRNKIKNNIEFRLRKNCSRSVCRMLKNKNSSKFSHSILQFLPYSIEELKIHIENHFDENMSWENYGIYWEIDHIIPQSILPYDSMRHENFKKCWALKNLRPYKISLNRSEGASKARHNINNNVLLCD